MNQPGLHFSLRKLFLATTLLATVICAAANYPVVLVATLCLVSPFLFTAAMAYFAAHLHVVERSILLAIGMAVLLAFLFGCIDLLLDGR